MKGLPRLKPRLQTLVIGGAIPKLAAGPASDHRGSSSKRGYGYAWQQARKRFLEQYPMCRECVREGFVEAATVVDHIEPHRGNKKLFWDEHNWQPLCKRHHDEKTGRGE